MDAVLFSVMPSPVGALTLRWSADALTGLSFDSSASRTRRRAWTQDDAALAPVRSQLEAYFSGERTAFDLPLAFAGTPFQQRVWKALLEIPYGTTTSYGELAERVGRPKYPGA